MSLLFFVFLDLDIFFAISNTYFVINMKLSFLIPTFKFKLSYVDMKFKLLTDIQSYRA